FSCGAAARGWPGAPRWSTHTPPQSGRRSRAAYPPFGQAAPCRVSAGACPAASGSATAASPRHPSTKACIRRMSPPPSLHCSTAGYTASIVVHDQRLVRDQRRGMRMGKLQRTALLIGLLAAGAASAHHSFAMFDQSQRVTLKGKVTEFQWTNPHAFIQMAVADAGGAAEPWSIELNSPNNLRRQG